MSDKKVKDVLAYAETLIGLPYKWWTPDRKDNDIFFYDQTIPREEIIKKGINCAGFINLLMRFAGVSFRKSVSKTRGGIVFWYNEFKQRRVLKPFDYNEKYPLGTLFLRKYRNKEDQGHVAVFYKKYEKDENKLLYGKIIHSHAYDGEGTPLGVDILGYSHFYVEGQTGYYEYAIYPQDWLT